MDAYHQIIARQQEWAKRQGIALIGSAGERGEKNYTSKLSENLFEPLSEAAKENFCHGNGNETVSTPTHTAKMQAIHSSSALGVNVFHYWQSNRQFGEIASACGFCEKEDCPTTGISFEGKYKINGIERIPPHLDIVFHNNAEARYACYAIESKFTEPFSLYEHGGLKLAYIQDKAVWESYPSLHRLALQLEPEDIVFKYLHAAQLIKHVLGLTSAFGKDGFKLLYLWYDVSGEESEEHKAEMEKFSSYAIEDGVEFSALTYQKVFQNLYGNAGAEHRRYLDYLGDRYF